MAKISTKCLDFSRRERYRKETWNSCFNGWPDFFFRIKRYINKTKNKGKPDLPECGDFSIGEMLPDYQRMTSVGGKIDLDPFSHLRRVSIIEFLPIFFIFLL